MKSLAAGGAERVMLRLAEGIADRGHVVDLVVCDGSGRLAESVPAEVRLVDLGAKQLRYGFLALVKYLRRDRPSALLSTLVHTNIAAVWATKLARVPTRLVLRADIALGPSLVNRSRLDRLMLPVLARSSYPRSDAIVAVSSGVEKDLTHTFGVPSHKVRTISNPIIMRDVQARETEPAHHPWLEHKDLPVVLGVGRLTAQKRFDLLLEAFTRLCQERPARLMLLGEGEEEALLENKANALGLGPEDVAFLGYVSNPLAYMARADLLVLASDYEGLPGVLIEALAVGCPVVSTDSPGGSREILREGAVGLLVPVGDADALSAAMAEALANPPDAELLRASAQRYSADINIERYLSVLLPQHPAIGDQADRSTEEEGRRRLAHKIHRVRGRLQGPRSRE